MEFNLLSNFTPPNYLRHPDVQNLLSSLGLRAMLLNWRKEEMARNTLDCVLDGGDGVRLSGQISIPQTKPNQLKPNQPKALVVLLHGWEGSSNSAYIVSAALTLFNAGYSVFRLNLRDHGDSHHLNEGIFNSTLLSEVQFAINDIANRWPHSHYYLAGFSLGGNFALRIALQPEKLDKAFDKIAAVCPVMDPASTLQALQQARFFYEWYFVRKWRSSLLKKLNHFPHYNYRKELLKLNDLESMHSFFVPRFTPFETFEDYFRAYAVTPEDLKSLQTPTTIINSLDDPITKADALTKVENSEVLSIHKPRYGSHCAYLKDIKLNSWLDDQLIRLFAIPS